MKRLLFILAITMATVFSVQAAHVSEAQARQIAGSFFSAKSLRAPSHGGQPTLQLAYTADREHFYIYDRGHSGFVVVAGDDRLPQVLGYSETGHFSATQVPPAMKYWMQEMNRQIAYLQEHDNVVAQVPFQHETAVDALMTTLWDQGTPFNDLCPTYTDNAGNTFRSVTGCVATAFAQVMNYYQWPDVGVGSHSYVCNVNDMTTVELSADFSQSVYRWDLMLDTYDENSDPESCQAVAKLMSDVGISMEMGYGASSGASEMTAMLASRQFFKYNEHSYLLNRDNFSAAEWDKILVDEITAGRPIIYCGYTVGVSMGGHAFVLDGYDTDGYFHVNWGWGGTADGYFLFTVLAPSASMNFEFMQDGIFGLVPNTQSDEVEQVLYVRGYLEPITLSAPLGSRASVKTEDFMVQGNKYSGFDEWNGEKNYYIDLPMSLGLFDSNGVERLNVRFSDKYYLDDYMSSSGHSIDMELPNDLEDGEYQLKLSYSLDEEANYDKPALDYNGNEAYIKMVVREGTAYFYDCYLANTYTVDAFDITSGATIDQPITVDTRMSFRAWGPSRNGPFGNVYLALLDKNDEEVATSEMYEVQMPSNTPTTYHMQIVAPSNTGLYNLVLKDEAGSTLYRSPQGWSWFYDSAFEPIYVLPVCESIVEDFESMKANNSTSDKDVQGNFATWTFYKSGVRAPGEGKCNGTNSVMMKKPSTFYTTQAIGHNYLLAQATFFNPSNTASKHTLEYSFDNGTTWQKALTIDSLEMAEVPEDSKQIVRWELDLKASQPATFRIAMRGGGSAATYVDDFILYYHDDNVNTGDVNNDGVINIADVNVLINLILAGNELPAADVNGDGVVNIADINGIIGIILK